MFDLFGVERKRLKNVILSLNSDIAIRDYRLKEKDSTIEALKRINKEQLEKIAIDSDIYIDFSKINVFSIERRMVDTNTRTLQTVIGYLLPDNNGGQTVKEWCFLCSQEQYEELVKHFNTHKLIGK